MMKKTIKTAIILFFAVCFVSNVFAGGGGQQSSAGKSGVPNPANDGPLIPYPATLEITVPLFISPNVYYATGESIEKNFVTDFYTEKLNIIYKGKWTVDSSDAAEKLNAAVASNDLPDMFGVSYEMLGRLIKAGQVQPIGDVYEKYATPRLREIANYQGGRGFLAGSVGGKLYAMPISNDFANNISMLYIRKDWLDKLGLAAPRTLDELIAVARAFRDRDPDGNGRNDTIAIAMDKSYGQDRATINALTNPLNAYSNIWIPDGSRGLKYGSIQPEMKEALQFIQGLYKEGLLDPEFAVKDGSKIAEDIAAGKIGIFPGVFWSSLWPLAGTIDNNPNADWLPVTISLNKDGKRITQNKIFSYDVVVVRAGFDHPEALIKSMNLWAEMFHGQYSDYFNGLLSTPKYMATADNWHGNGKPVFFSHPEKNIALSENFIQAWDAQNIDLCVTGEARNRYDIVKAGGSQGWAHKKFLLESEPLLKQYDDYVYDEFVGAPTNTMVLRTANLRKLEDEAFFAIIMGAPISTFDTFVRDWNAQGGNDITKEVNEWYRSVR
jgi:putative aldouronate transport system substrate-binding protein